MAALKNAQRVASTASQNIQIFQLTSDSLNELPICGVKKIDHDGRQQKTRWLETYFNRGLKAKTLLTPDNRQLGYIEYLPGEYAFRGVQAEGYMFIHCIWTFWKEYQKKGIGGRLVKACIDDARKAGMKGVAVVCRDSSWLADSSLFLKHGFQEVDAAPPDYQLLARKFDKSAPDPRFKGNWDKRLSKYADGLTIVYSTQCPHAVMFAGKVADAAREVFNLKPKMVEIKTHRDAQRAPTPYAVFAVINNGKLLADYHISRTRFISLMKQAGC